MMLQNKKILVLLLTLLFIGGFWLYQRSPNLLKTINIQKPQTAEAYCQVVNSGKTAGVQSVIDCGDYKIINPANCYDCGNGILDKNWDEIDHCGGLIGWSKECQEKYPGNNSCITTSCSEVAQKEFEKTYCVKMKIVVLLDVLVSQ